MKIKYHKKHKAIHIVVILLIAIIFCIIYFSFILASKITTITREEIKAVTNNAISKATLKVLGENVAYVDLVTIEYDKNGDINVIQVKSGVVNALVYKASIECQKYLSEMGLQGIQIPFGTLTGLYSLVGKGPVISLKILPIGSIKTQLYSQFNEAGINQTNHKLYLKINATVSILMPWNKNSISTTSEVLLLDSIIVGKVPDTYLNTTKVEDMLDLLP